MAVNSKSRCVHRFSAFICWTASVEFVEYITSSACSQPEAPINVPNRIHKENKILLSEILLQNAFCFLNITVAEIVFYMLLLLIHHLST